MLSIMDSPLVITPDLGRLTGSRQGQNLARIVGVDNAPECPFCQVEILMEPGKVTVPHIHDRVHVAVTLTRCDPTGVLTLFGDDFDRTVWLRQGQTLHIPPGLKHMAIRPRTLGWRRYTRSSYWRPAHAQETRSTGDWTEDVRPLPEDWGKVRIQLIRMDLMHRVDWPGDVVAATS